MANAPKNPIPAAVERVAKYMNNGLTVMSNNKSIHVRDEAGNIILQENSSTNPLLVIEPAKFQYSLNSFINTIDTNFNYYQFPVITYTTVDDNLLNIPNPNFDNVSYKQPEPIFVDTISTRMRIPKLQDGSNGGTSWIPVNTSYQSTWYDKQPSSGPRPVPFIGGNDPYDPNNFLITQTMIDELKKFKKVLKFKFFIQYRAFYQDGPTGFELKLLVKDDVGNWLGDWHMPTWRLVAPGINGQGGIKPDGIYPFITAELILHPDDLREHQMFHFETVTGNPAWLYADNCSWYVDVIDQSAVGKLLISMADSKPKSGVLTYDSGYDEPPFNVPCILSMRGGVDRFKTVNNQIVPI